MNYENVLKQTWANVPKIKLLPAGTWRLRVTNASYRTPKEGEERGAAFVFTYTPVAPADDVDETQLAELGQDYDLANNRIYYRLWYETARDLDKLRQHLEKHGVRPEADESIEATLERVKRREVMAYLSIRTYTTRTGETAVDNQPENFLPV